MPRIFNYGDILTIRFTPDKELNILIYTLPSYLIIYRSHILLKMVRFFGPPCTYLGDRSDCVECKYLNGCKNLVTAPTRFMLTTLPFLINSCAVYVRTDTHTHSLFVCLFVCLSVCLSVFFCSYGIHARCKIHAYGWISPSVSSEIFVNLITVYTIFSHPRVT